jgi:hypothetical protein
MQQPTLTLEAQKYEPRAGNKIGLNNINKNNLARNTFLESNIQSKFIGKNNRLLNLAGGHLPKNMYDETPKSHELATRSIYGQKVGDEKPGMKLLDY